MNQTREEQKAVLDAAWDGVACEYFDPSTKQWKGEGTWQDVVASISGGYRVRIKPEVDPYAELKALKAAHAEGKVIQVRGKITPERWSDWRDFDESSCGAPLWTEPVEYYRIKPEPVTVPLEAKDIPTPVAWISLGDGADRIVMTVTELWIEVGKTAYTYRTLMVKRALISSDRRIWEPCHKLVEQ